MRKFKSVQNNTQYFAMLFIEQYSLALMKK